MRSWANRQDVNSNALVQRQDRSKGLLLRREGFVILRILQRTDHCLGRQAVAHGIAAGTVFAFSVTGPVLLCALARLAASV